MRKKSKIRRKTDNQIQFFGSKIQIDMASDDATSHNSSCHVVASKYHKVCSQPPSTTKERNCSSSFKSKLKKLVIDTENEEVQKSNVYGSAIEESPLERKKTMDPSFTKMLKKGRKLKNISNVCKTINFDEVKQRTTSSMFTTPDSCNQIRDLNNMKNKKVTIVMDPK